MKKYLPFLIGLLLALPFSALAYILAQPDFPDVNRKASYADAVYRAYDAGWMSGYANGKFKPKKTVNRAELATTLLAYDKNMEKIYRQLKIILCDNKGNSLDELGVKVVDQASYSEALSGFCAEQWPGPVGCITPYDAKTGVYEKEFTRCP